jgi:hypothetical protein
MRGFLCFIKRVESLASLTLYIDDVVNTYGCTLAEWTVDRDTNRATWAKARSLGALSVVATEDPAHADVDDRKSQSAIGTFGRPLHHESTLFDSFTTSYQHHYSGETF